MIQILNQQNSILNNFIQEIRDKNIQKDSMRFRTNIERIGQIMAFELSKTLHYKAIDIETPLGIASENVVAEKIVIASILRAGLPLHNGLLSVFDKAENAFVSAYRKYIDKVSFDINVEYISAPNIKDKTLILCDPMLATGGSMELSYKALLSHGEPKSIHIVSIIASKQAIEHIQKTMPMDKTTLWIAAVDEKLNEHAYIVPGIGDAGDLAFGEKIDKK